MSIEKWGPWKLIKTGFWLGIGFIIPAILVDFASMASMWTIGSSVMESSFDEIIEDDEDILSMGQIDLSTIKIKSQKEVMNGKQLLILGEVVNESDETASTVEIEAELFDADGQFVYECSEYLSNGIEPGETENYQIKCGCNKNGVPEYSNIKVKVVRASSY